MNDVKKGKDELSRECIAELAWCGFALLEDCDRLREFFGSHMKERDPIGYRRLDPWPLMEEYERIRKGCGPSEACIRYAEMLLERGGEIRKLAEENVELSRGSTQAEGSQMRIIIGSASGFFYWYMERADKIRALMEEERRVPSLELARAARKTDERIVRGL